MQIAQSTEYKISREALAALLVAMAMSTSSIVFSEPAVADVLMMGLIIGLPMLGVIYLGPIGTTQLIMWLIIVAAGLMGTAFSVVFKLAVIHQIVTLYLALCAVAIGAYVAHNPIPRFHLIMRFYTLACIIAVSAALVGYFNIVPGTNELFTNYGRGRGTFKDPNVLGAAILPALAYVVWTVLRSPLKFAFIASGVALFLLIGLLITFSRGAWLGGVVTILTVTWFSLVSTRKGNDIVRLMVVTVVGLVAVVLAIGAIIQLEAVKDLFAERASFEQSYDLGAEGRFAGQLKAIALIIEHPFGVGTKNFVALHHPEQAHNVILTMFLYAGWIGGLLYVVSLGLTLLPCLRGALTPSAYQPAFIVTTSAFLVTVMLGFLVDTDHWRHFFLLLGLSWGLADGAMRAQRNTAEEQYA